MQEVPDHQQGAEVGGVLEEGGGQGEGGEVRVALGSQLSLSRTRSKVYLSSPASQQVQSLRGVNYFLHLKGGCVVLGLRLLHPKNADFSKVLLNFKVRCLGSSLPVQNQFL